MSGHSILFSLRDEVFAQTHADSSILGDGGFEVAVARRMSATRCRDIFEYEILYRNNVHERQHLLDETVVPETWFFRDTESYPQLIEHISPLIANSSQPLNILSVPCATGEEVYSLAALLSSLGISPQRAQIKGIDISYRCIQTAKHGIYGKYSLRGEIYPGTEGFIVPDGKTWRVSDNCKQFCTFERHDAFQYLCDNPGSFSVILCRNLLIYLNSETQHKLLTSLIHSLTPSGLLILSPAEAPLLQTLEIENTKRVSASCFIKEEISYKTRKTPSIASKLPESSFSATRTIRKNSEFASNQPFSVSYPRPTSELSVTHQMHTDNTHNLGDEALAGIQHLIEKNPTVAYERCTALIELGAAEIETFLTAAYAASQLNLRSAAEKAFRKVLYLNPTHEEALLQLAILVLERGDEREAARLRARALRSHERNEGRE